MGGKLNLWGLLWSKDTYIVTRIKGLLWASPGTRGLARYFPSRCNRCLKYTVGTSTGSQYILYKVTPNWIEKGRNLFQSTVKSYLLAHFGPEDMPKSFKRPAEVGRKTSKKEAEGGGHESPRSTDCV